MLLPAHPLRCLLLPHELQQSSDIAGQIQRTRTTVAGGEKGIEVFCINAVEIAILEVVFLCLACGT